MLHLSRIQILIYYATFVQTSVLQFAIFPNQWVRFRPFLCTPRSWAKGQWVISWRFYASRVSPIPWHTIHRPKAFAQVLKWQFVYSVPVSACICVFVSVQVSVFVSVYTCIYIHAVPGHHNFQLSMWCETCSVEYCMRCYAAHVDHTVMDAASAKFTKQITEVISFQRTSSAPLQINSSADDPFTSMSRSVRQSAQQDQIGMFTYMAHVYNANSWEQICHEGWQRSVCVPSEIGELRQNLYCFWKGKLAQLLYLRISLFCTRSRGLVLNLKVSPT